MKKEILEKLESATLLLITFLIDGIIVIFFGALSKGVPFILEKVYGEKFSKIDNKALTIVYDYSKYILIAFFVIFVLTHLILEIKKTLKKILE